MTAQARSVVGTALVGSEFLPDLAFFRSPVSFAGSSRLVFTIGGLPVRMTGFSAEQGRALQDRHGVFCRAGDERGEPLESRMDLQVVKADRPCFLRATGSVQRPEYYRVEIRWEGNALIATSYEWAGWFDASLRCGDLALAGSALEDIRAFDRSVENFLRVLYSHLVIHDGGFLLHSAGLVRHGRAYLFFGPSGAGKTTVTELSPDARILSDDLTLVVRGAPGEFRACSVPFRGVFAPRPESAETYPLAGFFRLVQDTADALEPLKGAAAIGEIIGSLPFVMDRPEMAGEVIDTVAAAAMDVPVFRLHIRKDRTFWRLIEARIDDFSQLRGIRS